MSDRNVEVSTNQSPQKYNLHNIVAKQFVNLAIVMNYQTMIIFEVCLQRHYMVIEKSIKRVSHSINLITNEIFSTRITSFHKKYEINFEFYF